MIGRLIITLALSLCTAPLMNAQEAESYGVEKAMPLSYQKIKATLSYPLSWEKSGRKNFDRWKEQGVKKLLECLSPAPPIVPFNLKVLETEQRNGYSVEKIAFNISAFDRASAYLLIPTIGKAPYPAIVLMHDHGAKFSIGKEKMVRPLKSEEKRIISEYGKKLSPNGKPQLEQTPLIEATDQWVKACYDGTYVGDYFASKGYIVLVTDALLWGERGRKDGSDYNAQEALACNLQQMGYSWCGIMTFDDISSVNLLKRLPQVDKDRIGTLGFSMGAHRAWMLSSACKDIKAGAAICWMNTTDSLMTMTNNQNKGGSAWSMLVPGLVNYMDYPDVAALACPKPMLFFNGLKDKLFPVGGVKDAYQTMHKVWKSRGADDRLITKFFDGPHFFSKPMQEEVLLFFDKYLKK